MSVVERLHMPSFGGATEPAAHRVVDPCVVAGLRVDGLVVIGVHTPEILMYVSAGSSMLNSRPPSAST
jgi:hypothetical protein